MNMHFVINIFGNPLNMRVNICTEHSDWITEFADNVRSLEFFNWMENLNSQIEQYSLPLL